MTYRAVLSIVILTAVATAAFMWHGVTLGSFSFTAWSAVPFAIVAVLAGVAINSPKWSRSGVDGPTWTRQLAALRDNGRLTALVYVWGAVALVAMYKLTGLYWQHALQYASGMTLFAAVIYGWTRMAGPGGRFETPEWTARAAQLNLVHGATAAVAAGIFLWSGKLWVDRPDWAANIVFLAGGFAITALCVLAAITHGCIQGNSSGSAPSS